MRKLLISLAVTTATLASVPARALTFDFSFTDTIGDVSGTVTGQIVGLSNNSTGPATALYIDSAPAGLDLSITTTFDVLSSTNTVDLNSFTVSGGQVTAGAFQSLYKSGSSADFSLSLFYDCTDCSPSTSGQLVNEPGDSLAVQNETTLSISPTPLPAALPLFGTGLFALGLLGWCRKRRAQAVTA